jgi:uncharacterized membrane protein
MTRPKQLLLYLMSAFYILAGFNHLVNPEFYVAIMPPNLPAPELLHVVAGLAEIVLGVFLLDRRARPFAAWGIIALLIAIFPANLYVARQNVGIGGPGTGGGTANWIRLPFQALFIAWAWWYTEPEPPARA